MDPDGAGGAERAAGPEPGDEPAQVHRHHPLAQARPLRRLVLLQLRQVVRKQVGDDTYMTSAKFLGFWTPSPLVRIQTIIPIVSPRNLFYFV